MAEAERIIGTPDIPDAAGAEPEIPDERPRGRRRIVVLFTVAALAYALDLVSKMIVVAKLEHHAPIEIIGDWLRFEAIRNAGAAFGMGEAFTMIFTVIAATVPLAEMGDYQPSKDTGIAILYSPKGKHLGHVLETWIETHTVDARGRNVREFVLFRGLPARPAKPGYP